MAYRAELGSTWPVRVTFHGGEPLLLGHNFFRDVLAYIGTLDDKFFLSVQTNLTLLDQHYCDIFKEHNVSISTSIDGPARFHNKFRGARDGDNHASVMRNIDLAMRNDLRVGAICIITPDKLPYAQEIYDFFCTNGINFKTNPPFLQGQAYKNWDRVCVPVNRYAAFQKDLFDIWYAAKPEVIIENLFNIIAVVLKGAGAGSCTNSNCASKHVTITANGDCFTCGRTTEYSEFCYGNIMHTSFTEMANSTKLHYFTNRVSKKIPVCSGCNFGHICFSGCMYEAYLLHGTVYSRDANCEVFKTIYTHIRDRIEADLVKLKREEDQNDHRHYFGRI